MSTDWGKTWTNLDNDDLPDMLTVSTLHVSDNGDLYVGSVNSGIFQLRVTESLELEISKSGFLSEGFFIDVAGGIAGLRVTSSANLNVPFANKISVIETTDEDGQPNRFIIPAASLHVGGGFFRVELD